MEGIPVNFFYIEIFKFEKVVKFLLLSRFKLPKDQSKQMLLYQKALKDHLRISTKSPRKLDNMTPKGKVHEKRRTKTVYLEITLIFLHFSSHEIISPEKVNGTRYESIVCVHMYV